jgi:CBS domain-containing protein
MSKEAAQTDAQSGIVELSTAAFGAFCEDISAMFGVVITCSLQRTSVESCDNFRKTFRGILAVNQIKADGFIEGTFHLIFDRVGLFVMGGIVEMPEQMTSLMEKCIGPQKIMKNLKSGYIKEAQQAKDAVSEVGNMLVGSWDRIFRERAEGHGHFVQKGTFIGDPWKEPAEKCLFPSNIKFLCFVHSMKVDNYPAFTCAAVFPEEVVTQSPAFAQITFSDAGPARQENASPGAPAPANAQSDSKPAEAESCANDATKLHESRTETEEVVTQSPAFAQITSDAEPARQEEASPGAPAPANAQSDSKPAEAESCANDATKLHESRTETVEETSRSAGIAVAVSANRPESKVEKTPHSLTASFTGQCLSAVCAKDIMQLPVVWSTPDESVEEALAKMQRYDTQYILVGDDEYPQGIVSNSTIAGAISPYLRPVFAKWRRPLDDATLHIRLKWIMSRPVRIIRPETPLGIIIENMCRFGTRCLPVVNEAGTVEGIVTVFDIFRFLNNDKDSFSTGKPPQVVPVMSGNGVSSYAIQ